jgi:hypothetical protein
MINNINDAISSIKLFFGGSYSSYESIHPIRNFLGLYSIEMCLLGNSDINKKHKNFYSHLIIANKDESIKIGFICNHSSKDDMAMFCTKDNAVYEFNDKNRLFISSSEFSGYVGLNMLAVAKKFCEGAIEDDLKISNNELINDIIIYSRSVA